MIFQRYTSSTLETETVETDWAAAAAKRQEKCRESIEKSQVTERQTKQDVRKRDQTQAQFYFWLVWSMPLRCFSFSAKRATNKCTDFHLG